MWRRAELTREDVGKRLPVWQALSDLFLDTELQPADYRDIARQLRGSGYSAGELWLILIDEVMPASLPNLLSVAGEWTSWSEEEVREIMARSLRSKLGRSLKRRVGGWMFGRDLRKDWAKISDLMEG